MKINNDHEQTELQGIDHAALLAALDQPEQATSALKAAFQLYQSRIVSDVSQSSVMTDLSDGGEGQLTRRSPRCTNVETPKLEIELKEETDGGLEDIW